MPPRHDVYSAYDLLHQNDLWDRVPMLSARYQPLAPTARPEEIALMSPAAVRASDPLLMLGIEIDRKRGDKIPLDGLEEKRKLASGDRDRYLREIAKMTCEAGGTCAFIGTGNTDNVHAAGSNGGTGPSCFTGTAKVSV